ncbi:MAG: hypothetical protein FWD13_07330 [Treponema sp.]|nr:hypothetical protein [Treponema sp.]
MKKLFLVIFLLFCSTLVYSTDRYSSINTNLPFYFETGEYYNQPQTAMLMGMGLNITDRILFKDNFGVNLRASFIFPMFLSAIIEYPENEIYEARYDFLSYIIGTGFGTTFNHNMFFLDTGVHFHYFSMKNIFSKYTNNTIGFYAAPAFILPLDFVQNGLGFEIGIKTGFDLYSNSTIKLLIENKTMKYRGWYNLFYFNMFYGLSFKT